MYSPEEIAEAGLDDFRNFLREVWAYLRLPPPTPLQLDIAYTLQHGDRRQIIEGFRGVAKSWITVAFVLWLLFCDPQRKIMVVSASQKHADNFSTFCKSLINGMDLLQFLAARPGQRDSNIMFDVGPAREDLSPSVKSVGLTGQLTGSRADYIIADDIEVPKNSFTHVMRERISELVKEFDAVLKPNGCVIYLGTPQIEASLYNRLVLDRGYTVRIWPSEIPEDLDRYGGKLAPYIMDLIARGAKPHDPTEPSRFGREDLDERLASYGRSGYALQYMLDTNPSDAERNPLKLRDLVIQDCDAELGHVRVVWGADKELVINDLEAGGHDGDRYHRPAYKSSEMAKYSGTVMAIDPSGLGADETAYAIVRYLYGQQYLVDVGGYKDGFGEATLKALAAKAARHHVNDIICEENYGGGMFTQLLKPVVIRVAQEAKVAPARFIEDKEFTWSRGQKELRILDTLEPLVQSHRLSVDRRVIEDDLKLVTTDNSKRKYSFVYQFTRMSRDRGALANEDRLEAVAMACAYWIARMDRDKENMEDKHKEELLQAELQTFHDHVFSINGSNADLVWQDD